MDTAPWNRFQMHGTSRMRPLTAEERKANGVSRPAALETAATVDSGHTLLTDPMPGLKDSLDQAIASVKSYLHTLDQAKKAVLSFKSSPTLQPGDVADMWHEGTRKFYRATVQHQVTEEEATRG